MPNLHLELFNTAIALGYLPETADGICHGFTMRWIEACLLGEAEVNRLTERMNNLLDPSKTIEERDLHAFLDSLILYHHPEKYPDIHGGYYSQHNIKAVSRMAASDLMKEQGGLVSIDMQSWMYTQDDIGEYLQRVANQLEELGSPEPSTIALALDGTNHSIGLTYQVGTGLWTVMDINQWPARSSNNIEDISDIVYQGFMRANAIDTPYVGFNTSIVMTNNQATQYHDIDILAITGTNYPLSDEVLSRHSGGTFAYIAAKNGHANIILALHHVGAKFNVPHNNGATPAFVAAQNGHANVIRALAQVSPELLSIQDINGTTPAFVAAQHGHEDVINALAEARADLTTPYNNDVTPALIAAQEGHADVIKALAAAQVDLSTPNNNGYTPAFIAAYSGQAAVIKALAEAHVDLTTPDANNVTPALIATQAGHASVIRALIEINPDLLSAANNNGISLAFIAAKQGQANVIKELPLDDSACRTTAASLRDFAKDKSIETQERIAAFIADSEGSTILITPEEMATLLGYVDVVSILREKRNLLGENDDVTASKYKSPSLFDRPDSKAPTPGGEEEIENKDEEKPGPYNPLSS